MLALQFSATECGVCGATPVPLKPTAAGEPEALLAMLTLPFAAPAADGANCTLTAMLWFGDSVTAPPPLVIEYPEPLADIPEIATFELPVLVTVKLCVAELPSFTLPKLRLLGLTLMLCVEATPVPLSATAAGEFGALLITDTLPLVLPAEVGAYCTVKLLLCPGVKVIGAEMPLRLKPLPVTVACEIVRLAFPLFLTCTVCVFALPVATEPKLALDGVTLSAACAPVPVTAATVLIPSLLVTVMLPDTAPVAVGAYCTVIAALCEGANVTGMLNPLTETPAPLATTCVTVTLEFPVFESCKF